MSNQNLIKIVKIIEEDTGTQLKLSVDAYDSITILLNESKQDKTTPLDRNIDLRAIRRKYDLTQDELASALKVSRAGLAQIETGRMKISHKMFYKIEQFIQNKNGI